ncbi:MAG: chlorite dismutase family protein [Thermoplasmata archaeon]
MNASAPPPRAKGDAGARDFVRYLFWHLRPEWRRQSQQDRAAQADEFVGRVEQPPEGVAVRTYSTVGAKVGVDGLLWMVSSRLEAFQEFEGRLRGSDLSGYLDWPFGFLGLTQRSQYLGGHAHARQEGPRVRPSGRPYLFVYPFVKKRAWYGLPFEERRRIMGEHFQIGHKFPDVEIHTGYSLGLDDPEFILAFESDSPGEFLDLVSALRPSEASRYTELETPIFTCVAATPRRMVELAAGLP